MSREKTSISSLNLNKIGGRIAFVRLKNGQTQEQFALTIGISKGNLSGIETNKSFPSYNPIVQILKNYDLDPLWLLTGEGEMIRASKNEAGKSGKDILLYDRNDGDEVRSSRAEYEVSPEMAELVGKTRKILSSDTDYAASLSANIRSFHHAITTEEHMHRMDSDMSEVKDAIKTLLGECDEIKERLSRSDSAVRREDTEEQRDNVRKKRAV